MVVTIGRDSREVVTNNLRSMIQENHHVEFHVCCIRSTHDP